MKLISSKVFKRATGKGAIELKRHIFIDNIKKYKTGEVFFVPGSEYPWANGISQIHPEHSVRNIECKACSQTIKERVRGEFGQYRGEFGWFCVWSPAEF